LSLPHTELNKVPKCCGSSNEDVGSVVYRLYVCGIVNELQGC